MLRFAFFLNDIASIFQFFSAFRAFIKIKNASLSKNSSSTATYPAWKKTPMFA